MMPQVWYYKILSLDSIISYNSFYIGNKIKIIITFSTVTVEISWFKQLAYQPNKHYHVFTISHNLNSLTWMKNRNVYVTTNIKKLSWSHIQFYYSPYALKNIWFIIFYLLYLNKTVIKYFCSCIFNYKCT